MIPLGLARHTIWAVRIDISCIEDEGLSTLWLAEVVGNLIHENEIS